MKRVWLVTVLLAGCLTQPLPTSPGGRLAAPDAQQGRTEGEKLFSVACARCHGDRGQGGPGPSLRASRYRSEQDLLALIKSPGHEMPARGGYPVLTEAQLHRIVAHLRTLP